MSLEGRHRKGYSLSYFRQSCPSGCLLFGGGSHSVWLQEKINSVESHCRVGFSGWGQGPAGNRTTRRPPDHRRETQTEMVSTCLPFIRSGQNRLAGLSEKGKKTRRTEDQVGRQHQGMNMPGVRRVQESSGEQIKCRKLVVKSSVVPQRSSRLRNK